MAATYRGTYPGTSGSDVELRRWAIEQAVKLRAGTESSMTSTVVIADTFVAFVAHNEVPKP